MRSRWKTAGVVAGTLAMALLAAACGSDSTSSASSTTAGAPTGSGSTDAATSAPAAETSPAQSAAPSEKVTLTVYTDQHADMIEGLTKAYTDQTGVTFKIQNDASVGQLQTEGSASPADVFLSEDPMPAAQLGAAGLFVPVDPATLAQVRPGLSSGKGLWVAYAARARVLVYNPKLIGEDELPATLAEIVDPQYKGKLAWAPSGAFVATTQYLLSTQGIDATKAFLEGVKANGVNEKKNGNVRDTVEAGTHAMGLTNHYYWWILAAQKGGPDQLASKIYHFPTEDPGNLILSSGAGILATSKHIDEAQKFLAWLTSRDGGQKVIAEAPIGTSGAQYPVATGVASSIVGDLSEIKSPTYDMDLLAEADQAKDLLKELGMSGG